MFFSPKQDINSYHAHHELEQAVTLNYFYLVENTYYGEETAVFPILLFFKQVPFI